MYEWSSWRTLVCKPLFLNWAFPKFESSNRYWKDSLRSLRQVPLILGILGLVGFVLYSTYISSQPLIRRSLFNTSTAITAYAGTLIHGITVWSLLYYMPLYFEVAKNYNAVDSGIAIFPFTFTVAPAAVAVGIVIAKTGRYRLSIVSSPIFSNWCKLILSVDRLVPHYVRPRPSHLSSTIHQHAILDFSFSRGWYWDRSSLLSPRLCSTSIFFERQFALFWSSIQVRQTLP